MLSNLLEHQELVLGVSGSGPHKMPFHTRELQCTHQGDPGWEYLLHSAGFANSTQYLTYTST